jgi:hypothetical protein
MLLRGWLLLLWCFGRLGGCCWLLVLVLLTALQWCALVQLVVLGGVLAVELIGGSMRFWCFGGGSLWRYDGWKAVDAGASSWRSQKRRQCERVACWVCRRLSL